AKPVVASIWAAYPKSPTKHSRSEFRKRVVNLSWDGSVAAGRQHDLRFSANGTPKAGALLHRPPDGADRQHNEADGAGSAGAVRSISDATVWGPGGRTRTALLASRPRTRPPSTVSSGRTSTVRGGQAFSPVPPGRGRRRRGTR